MSGVDDEAPVLQAIVQLRVADRVRQSKGVQDHRAVLAREQRLDAEGAEAVAGDAETAPVTPISG
ncbi:MAG: hypothetical protein ACREV8_13520, partial [Gammaproteobacteria bacterium]